MPQASDELRDLMKERFGDEIDCSQPLKFLLDRGFSEKAGMISKPAPDYVMNDQECDCVDYLCDEWDFAYQ